MEVKRSKARVKASCYCLSRLLFVLAILKFISDEMVFTAFTQHVVSL